MRPESKPRTAIAGAGMTGAYLYRLLRNRGLDAEIFDIGNNTRCGMHPCAWGTSRAFIELVAHSKLNPEEYVIRRFDHLVMENLKIEADLMTFDKQKLIEDLLRDAHIIRSALPVGEFDRIIDATGVARAFLPPVEGDVVMGCVQRLVQSSDQLENRIKLGDIGYAWCFPLSENRYHIGCGSLEGDPSRRLKVLSWLEDAPGPSGKQLICGCKGGIRLTGPHSSLPFFSNDVSDGIWGVGEAIGCVAPLAGDGVVPGMKSVQILLENWDHPEAYTQGILREFKWMKSERRVIDRLIGKKSLGIGDAWVLRRNSRRMGMSISLGKANILMKRLR